MQSGLPRAKKSVFLKGPGELRSQVTVLVESAGSTLLPPLVPAKPKCQAGVCTPTSALRGCQGGWLGEAQDAHICTEFLNRCWLSRSHVSSTEPSKELC